MVALCLFVCLSVCSSVGRFFCHRYGIPGKHAKGFEACLAKELGETLDTVSEHLYRITKMLSPVYLQQANVRWLNEGHAGGAGKQKCKKRLSNDRNHPSHTHIAYQVMGY